MKKMFFLLLISAMAALAGCGDTFYYIYDDITGPVQSVKVRSTMSVVVGQTEQLSATVYPLKTPNKKVTWTTSNSSIVDVDLNTGVVTASSNVGQSATITVTTDDGHFTDECIVTVVPVPVPIESLSFSYATTSLGINASKTLEDLLLIDPSDATSTEMKWKSSNVTIASVDSDTGVVTGHSVGNATITATSTTWGKSATIVIIVGSLSDNADLSGIMLSIGNLSPQFSAEITTYNASVANGISSITVTAFKADPNASIVVSPAQPSSLTIGWNPITITVTSESGVTKNYTVRVDRAGDYTSVNIGLLKYVPAGSFQRDTTSTNISTITSGYRMSRYEITRAQFTAVTALSDPSDVAVSNGTTDPVQRVNFYHMLVFCNKLSINEGLTPAYTIAGSTDPAVWGAIPTSSNPTWNAVICDWSSNGYRLPTEMEWMWAAMGATSDSKPGDIVNGINTGGYAKSFSGYKDGTTVIGNYVWYSVNSGGKTHPAGTKNSNELGLYDMSGNVWELCWDYWYSGYSGPPAGNLVDYSGSISGTDHLIKGYSFSFNAGFFTNLWDDWSHVTPIYQSNSIGFRIVRR